MNLTEMDQEGKQERVPVCMQECVCVWSLRYSSVTEMDLNSKERSDLGVIALQVHIHIILEGGFLKSCED